MVTGLILAGYAALEGWVMGTLMGRKMEEGLALELASRLKPLGLR